MHRRGAGARHLQPGRGLRRRRRCSTRPSPRSARCWPAAAGTSVAELGRHLYVHYAAPAVAAHVPRWPPGWTRWSSGSRRSSVSCATPTRTAVAGGAVGTVLHDLAQRSLHVGKRVHTETAIDHAGASVVSVALDRAAIVAAGIGRRGRRRRDGRARRHHGHAPRGAAPSRWRTAARPRAERLAAAVGGRPARSTTSPPWSPAADVLVSSTGAVGTVVDTDLVGDRSRAPAAACSTSPSRATSTPPSVSCPASRCSTSRRCASPTAPWWPTPTSSRPTPSSRAELDTYLAAQRAARGHADRHRAARAGGRGRRGRGRAGWRAGCPAWTSAPAPRSAAAVRRAVEKLLHVPTVRVKELAATPGRRRLHRGPAGAVRPRPRLGRVGRRRP